MSRAGPELWVVGAIVLGPLFLGVHFLLYLAIVIKKKSVNRFIPPAM
jgi:hypothetical protein